MCSVVLHQSFVCFFFINGIKTLFTNPDPTCPVLSLDVTRLYFMSAFLRSITGHIKAPRPSWRWKEGGGEGRRRGEEEGMQHARTLIFFIR